MDKKAIFLEQHQATHDQNNWFVALKSALEGVTEEQTIWKSSSNSNSINEIVHHLIFWNERYLNRFKGKTVGQVEVNNDETFLSNDDHDWEKTVQKINEIFDEWNSIVKDSDDEKLDRSPYGNATDSWWSVLSNMTIHNAYHIGQIIQIRKQQGSWDPSNGVH